MCCGDLGGTLSFVFHCEGNPVKKERRNTKIGHCARRALYYSSHQHTTLFAGVPTTLPFHNLIMLHPKFQEGDVDTGFIVKYADDLTEPEEPKTTNPNSGIVAQAVKKKSKR